MMMPVTKVDGYEGIPIMIHLETEDVEKGRIFYHEKGPYLILDSGEKLGIKSGAYFSFGDTSSIIRNSKLQIELQPEVVSKLRYSHDGLSRIQMYPPSTDKWLAHVAESGIDSIFTVQRLRQDKKKLLTIVDSTTMQMLYAGLIQSYESSILSMARDWDVHEDIIYSGVSEPDIFEILDERPPSWSTISELIGDIVIPSLEIKKTMGETLEQLVPPSYPTSVRKQILAFLGWLEKAEIPHEDPTDILVKLRSVGTYGVFMKGHLQCMLDGIKPPEYVKLIHQADRGQIHLSQRPLSEADEQNPWTMLWFKLLELFPDWMGRVLSYAISLQDQGRIITDLPISKTEARKSKRAWSDRFAMVHHALFLRGHVHKESIGLLPVLYIGGAHRWPHKHLEWTARLGYGLEKPRYIQIMTMPKSAIERVSRIIPSIRQIDWEMSKFNLSLYNNAERKWTLKKSMLLKSLKRKRSMKQLRNEFGGWKGGEIQKLTTERARILDLVSWVLYIGTLESGRYAKYYGLDNVTIQQELEEMHTKGIFDLQYLLVPEKLRSLCILANGPSQNICSMSRSFLRYIPSTQVRLTEGGRSCIIVSRVPEDEFRDFAIPLTDVSEDTELSIQVYPISAYAGYRHNLYSRLLKDDGTWDDDISGLIDQVRLRPKDNDD